MIYTIIPIENSHIKPLAALEKQCFTSPWSVESIAEQLDNPLAHFLVTVAGKAVAGYIGTQEIAGECYITNIAVSPEYRRSGIAQAPPLTSGKRLSDAGFSKRRARLSRARRGGRANPIGSANERALAPVRIATALRSDRHGPVQASTSMPAACSCVPLSGFQPQVREL